METPPTFTWAVSDGPGAIDAGGLFTIPSSSNEGSASIGVTASDGATGGTTATVSAVIQLTATATSDTTIAFSTSVPADVVYTIEEQAPGGNFQFLGSHGPSGQPEPPTEADFLQPNTTYQFRIHADLASGWIYSPVVTVTTEGAPSDAVPKPTNVQYYDLFGPRGQLSYSQGTYDASRYTPYEVMAQVPLISDPNSWKTVNIEPWTPQLIVDADVPAPGGKSFAEITFRLTEIYKDNLTGDIVYSEPSDPFTMNYSASLEAPSDLSVQSLGNGSYIATWIPTPDTQTRIDALSTAVTGWVMAVCPEGVDSLVFTPYTNTDLNMVAWAVDSTGENSYAVTAPMPALPVKPAAPIVESISVVPNPNDDETDNAAPVGIQIIWDDDADNETGYTVLRLIDGVDGTYEQIAALPADAESYVDTTFEAGNGLVCYKIVASNAAGSNQVITGITNPFPPAPTALTATANEEDGSINLSWTAASDPSGLVTGYEIQWSDDGTNFVPLDTVPRAETTYTDSLPTEDVQNYYRVVAFDTINGANLDSVPTNTASDDPIAASPSIWLTAESTVMRPTQSPTARLSPFPRARAFLPAPAIWPIFPSTSAGSPSRTMARSPSPATEVSPIRRLPTSSGSTLSPTPSRTIQRKQPPKWRSVSSRRRRPPAVRSIP